MKIKGFLCSVITFILIVTSFTACTLGSNGTNGRDGVNGQNGIDGKDGKNGLDGQDGKNGLDGQDGISINWRGSYESEEEIYKPQYLDAFYKLTDGCSYIYDGQKWTLLAKSATNENTGSGQNGSDGKNGVDGQNGKDGISIIWRGSFTSADDIENPELMNAYYNTSNGCSYIYDGTTWNLLAKSGNTEVYDVSLSISAFPDKLTYYTNENLDLSGLKVLMNKTDGTSTLLDTDDYEVLPANGTQLTESGSQVVKITSNEKTVLFVITVIERPVITVNSIVLNTSSVKRYYGTGEFLDLSGLTVTAIYSDGTSSVLNDFDSVPAIGSVFNNVGMQTISILAEGKSASFDIQVLQDAAVSATIAYEVYTDISNLLSFDSLANAFTALPNYDSYRWYVDEQKQAESSNTFKYGEGKNHTITVIVNAAGKKYSAQMRIE